MEDNLTVKGIKEFLKDQNLNLSVLNEVDSTNTYLKALAREGEKPKTIVIADSQQNGHGRYDRKFHSPSGSGIYMSILIKPELEPENAVLITAAAAVAVCEAVETLTDKKTSIKWVNDCLIDGRKICGILTEGSINPQDGRFDWTVVGIGINAYLPENGFSEDICNIAGAVFGDRQVNLRNKLTAEIINRFFYHLEHLASKEFLTPYKERLNLLGREITVFKNKIPIEATALDLDDKCRLKVKYKNGETEYLSSGEVSIKGAFYE